MVPRFLIIFFVILFVGAAIASIITAVVIHRIRQTETTAQNTPAPAGLWVRAAAFSFDYAIVYLLTLIWIVLLGFVETRQWADGHIWLVALIGMLLIPLVYFTLPYSLRKQTWGKRFAGLTLESQSGTVCGEWRALWRSVVLLLCSAFFWGLPLLVDMLTLAFHPEKRALHDLLAGSQVRRVKRPSLLLALAPLVGAASLMLLVIGVRICAVEAFYLPSSSMSPTLPINDRLLANKLYYRFSPVQRGDIIVFHSPKKRTPKGRALVEMNIKRVIGLPGETIQIKAGVGIFVNGTLLHDKLPIPSYDWPTSLDGKLLPPFQLAKDEYFVLGDYRDSSLDSHYWRDATTDELAPGLPAKNIVGKATAVFWPLEHARVLKSPY